MIHAVAGLRPRTTIVHDAVLVGYRPIANARAGGENGARHGCG
jgi:hypothetical protein